MDRLISLVPSHQKRPDNYFILAFYSERLASPLLAIAVISRWLPHLIYYKDFQYAIEIARRACVPLTTKIEQFHALSFPCLSAAQLWVNRDEMRG